MVNIMNKVIGKVSRLRTPGFWKVYKVNESCYEELVEFTESSLKQMLNEYCVVLEKYERIIKAYIDGSSNKAVWYIVAYLYGALSSLQGDPFLRDDYSYIQMVTKSVLNGSRVITREECDLLLCYINNSKGSLNVNLIDIINMIGERLNIEGVSFNRFREYELLHEIPLHILNRMVGIVKLRIEIRFDGSVKVYLVNERGELINTNRVCIQ
jgi:hypothetical protein